MGGGRFSPSVKKRRWLYLAAQKARVAEGVTEADPDPEAEAEAEADAGDCSSADLETWVEAE